jgi:Sulfotransferase family
MRDFLCVGAQKAGTTWLHANLKTHPAVWTPPFVKEVHFFDVQHLGYDKGRRLQKIQKRCRRLIQKKPDLRAYLRKVMDASFAFTDDWYKHIFSIAPQGMVKGESTPLYSALDEAGVQHVKQLMPEARIIYLIRDPFDRAKSSLGMKLARKENWTEEEMIEAVTNPFFQKRGSYAQNIAQWDKGFPAEQILYLPFGRIKTEPESVMRDVEAHLGLNPYEKYPKLTHQVNATKKKPGAEISEKVLQMLRDQTASEYPYLKQRFGEEFCSKIK